MALRHPSRLALMAGAALLLAASPAAATVYVTGTTTPLSSYAPGTFDLGTHLPGYIGPTVGSSSDGTNLDGNRVYMFDINDPGGPNGTAGTASFNLLVWQFAATKDSVRLYTHQDHYNSDSFLSVPVTHNDVIYGVLNLSNKKDGSLFGNADLDRATLLSQFLAMSRERLTLGRRAQLWA